MAQWCSGKRCHLTDHLSPRYCSVYMKFLCSYCVCAGLLCVHSFPPTFQKHATGFTGLHINMSFQAFLCIFWIAIKSNFFKYLIHIYIDFSLRHFLKRNSIKVAIISQNTCDEWMISSSEDHINTCTNQNEGI